jgi:AcrR family transcriptional regulator
MSPRVPLEDGAVPLSRVRFQINIINMKLETTRPYRMAARAQSTAATGQRILDATVELFWERPTDQIALEQVAARAGVTVQTVIRRFGSKDALIAAATERESARVAQQRLAPVGDVVGAVEVLMEHYETTGDRVLKLLAEEERTPGLREIADRGRVVHRDWCVHAFAPALEGRHGVGRQRRLAQLVAVCDVYTWKLLRHDAQLSRRQTTLAIVELLTPLMEER